MATAAKTIPKGYKQTDVGVIPHDWEPKRIGDIFRVTRGQVLSMRKVSPVRLGDYQYPVYSSQTEANGLAGYYTKFLFDSCITWTTDGANAGDVKYRPGKFYCTNVCGVLENKLGYANLCIAAIFNSVSRKYVSYVGNPKLMNNVVADIVIGIPSTVQEQTAIANTLSDTDALIEKLTKLIEKKKNIKQGAMQELLTGKRRLPGFSGKWETKKLGDFFFLSATYSKTKFINDGGNYLIMDMGSVSSDGEMIASKKTFSTTDLLKSGDLIMPKDDIGGGNIIGKVAHIGSDNKYILGDHVYKLTAKISNIDTLFFAYLINSYAVNYGLKKKVSGSAQLGLGRRSVEEQDVKIPEDKNEQTAIATVLSDVDTEIKRLESQLAKYQNVKQGMMQTLLTGKIRLI